MTIRVAIDWATPSAPPPGADEEAWHQLVEGFRSAGWEAMRQDRNSIIDFSVGLSHGAYALARAFNGEFPALSLWRFTCSLPSKGGVNMSWTLVRNRDQWSDGLNWVSANDLGRYLFDRFDGAGSRLGRDERLEVMAEQVPIPLEPRPGEQTMDALIAAVVNQRLEGKTPSAPQGTPPPRL